MEKKETIFNRTNLARILLVVFDVLAINFAYYITLVIRFYVAHSLPEASLAFFEAFWEFAPYYTVICIVVFYICKLYNSVWRYVGINDIHRIMRASVVTAILNVIGSVLFIKRMPISYYIIGAIIQFSLIAVSRFSYRIYLMEIDRYSKKKKISVNVMIVGIGETARIVRSRIDNDRSNSTIPVCVFTTKVDRKDTILNGLPLVTGLDKLSEAIEKYNVHCCVLADSTMSSDTVKTIRKICEEKTVEFQDFSEAFSTDADTKFLIKILENTKGNVELVTGVEVKKYSSGEKALNDLSGGYSISEISVNENSLILVLTDSKKVISSPKDDWVKKADNYDKNDVSFF